MWVVSQDSLNSLNLVRALLAKGADLNAQDKLGRTAAMIAKEKGRAALMQVLSGDPSSAPSGGRSVIVQTDTGGSSSYSREGPKAAVAAQDFATGNEAYKNRDYPTALQHFRPLAEVGDVNAQFYLGQMYSNGEGVRFDPVEAIKWYQRAAEKGLAVAQYTLAVHYAEGKGVAQNQSEAVKWYRKAADQGQVNAQYNLGQMYLRGEGVVKDYVEALRWYRKAAVQGHAGAQNNIGVLFQYGRGVSTDVAEAAKWYYRAAEQSYPAAQTNLGLLYANGDAVEMDPVLAYMWFALADKNSESRASKALAAVEAQMTKDQTDKARRFIDQWQPGVAWASLILRENPSIKVTELTRTQSDESVITSKLRNKPSLELSYDEAERQLVLSKDAIGWKRKYELQAEEQIVYDGTTGLFWQRNDSGKFLSRDEANAYVKSLNEQSFAGRGDWRLPTLEEAMSLMEEKPITPLQLGRLRDVLRLDPLFRCSVNHYWSSDYVRPRYPWLVNYSTGGVAAYSIVAGGWSGVRAVRGD